MSFAVRIGNPIHYHSADSDHSDGLDHSFGFRRLKKNALTLIAAHAEFAYLGDDCVVEDLAIGHGFAKADLVILRLKHKRQVITMICVADRVWAQQSRALGALKASIKSTNRHVVLVRESFIQRQPRLSNADAIAGAFDVVISYEDRMAVFALLLENGYSTLGDCAAALTNAAPFSAVLKMVGMGLLEMDLNRKIDLNSRIDLAGELSMAA